MTGHRPASEAELQHLYETALAESARQGAPVSTVEALMIGLRDRGADALCEAETRHRLAALSTAQLREVIGRLMRLRDRYPDRYPAIADDLLLRLGDLL
jgi:hypothetical protein